MRRFLGNVHWGDKLIDILVVVLGITIAFGLNNWRENRQNAKLEQRYLKNLKEDLVKDTLQMINIKRDLRGTSFAVACIKRISPEIENADSVAIYLDDVFSLNYFIFFPEDYTYETLQQSGDISIIQSDSIRQVLSQLYDNYEYMRLLYEYALNTLSDEISPYVDNLSARTSQVEDPTMYQSTHFDNLVNEYGRQLAGVEFLVESSLEKHRILQHLISKELNK
ncbi:MAG: DUF6090 family protein [Bacteroidota bacterium]